MVFLMLPLLVPILIDFSGIEYGEIGVKKQHRHNAAKNNLHLLGNLEGFDAQILERQRPQWTDSKNSLFEKLNLLTESLILHEILQRNQ